MFKPMPHHKKCRKCLVVKPKVCFSPRPDSSGGRYSYCRGCKRTAHVASGKAFTGDGYVHTFSEFEREEFGDQRNFEEFDPFYKFHNPKGSGINQL